MAKLVKTVRFPRFRDCCHCNQIHFEVEFKPVQNNPDGFLYYAECPNTKKIMYFQILEEYNYE